jgi:hypothetical protein
MSVPLPAVHELEKNEGGVLRAMLRGSVGFAIVSIAAFSVWAFAGRWLGQNFGEAGLYIGCLIVFLGVSGLLLRSLVQGANSLGRFYKIFIPAFLAYAMVWCAAWFELHFGAGEWVGLLGGMRGVCGVSGERIWKLSRICGGVPGDVHLPFGGIFFGRKMHGVDFVVGKCGDAKWIFQSTTFGCGKTFVGTVLWARFRRGHGVRVFCFSTNTDDLAEKK